VAASKAQLAEAMDTMGIWKVEVEKVGDISGNILDCFYRSQGGAKWHLLKL
jgi:hypothetical protein